MKKNILFITNTAFNKTSGGSILFTKLFKYLLNSDITCFICDDKKSINLFYQFKLVFNFYSPIFSNYYFNIIARRYILFGTFFYFFKYRILPKYIIYKHKNKFNIYNKVWIYTSQQTIPISKLIHQKYQIKYHLTIQDDYTTHLKCYEHQYLQNDFKYLLENASSIDFISNYSEEYYLKNYKIKANTTNYIDSIISKCTQPAISNKITRIGFAGNIWCGDTINAFLKAIKLYNNLNIDSKIIFVLFSNINKNNSIISKHKEFVELNSFVSYDLLIKNLQNCDLLYLPMTFEKDKFKTNITSFPSKIITYLNASIPILNHSPSISATHDYVVKNNIGVSLNTMHYIEIFYFISNIDAQLSYSLRQIISKNMRNLINQFELNNNQKKLLKLISFE